MDYLTLNLGDTNPILLLELVEGFTLDFKHGFLQMLENNSFSGIAHCAFLPYDGTLKENK